MAQETGKQTDKVKEGIHKQAKVRDTKALHVDKYKVTMLFTFHSIFICIILYFSSKKVELSNG